MLSVIILCGIMLSVIIMSNIMLSVIMMSVIMMSVIMLSVIMLRVVVMSVAAPCQTLQSVISESTLFSINAKRSSLRFYKRLTVVIVTYDRNLQLYNTKFTAYSTRNYVCSSCRS